MTEQEIEELKEFDEKMTAYQKQLTTSLQAQVKEIFGNQFASLFGQKGSSEVATTVAPVSEETATAAPLEAPDAPNFCTLIF